MSYKVFNLDDKTDIKGWLCGQFFPDNDIRKTDNLEVKFNYLEPGFTMAEHFHPLGDELFIVLKGKIKMKFDGIEQILVAGDYVFQKPNTKDALLEVFEPSECLTVRSPSVPNNKVEVKQ